MSYVKNRQLDSNNQVVKVAVWSVERNNWSAVSTAKRSLNQDVSNGTFQIVEKGDVLLITDYDLSGELFITTRQVVWCNENGHGDLSDLTLGPVDSMFDIGHIFENATDNLYKWLRDNHETVNGFIPAGIGWDGIHTLYEQRKRDKIRSLLFGVQDETLVINIIESGQISSGRETPTEWGDAIGLAQVEPCELDWDIRSNTRQAFAIVWFKDNRCEVYKYDDPSADLTFEVHPGATKLMLGELNSTGDNSKTLTRWKLYTR